MQIQLFVKSKADNAVQDFRCELQDRLVLGRGDESPVPFEDSAISREHLALRLEAGEIFAVDLSNNGSWVNGKRIPRGRGCRVGEEDSIEVPGYEIRVHLLPESVAPPPAAQPLPAAISLVSRWLGTFTGLERLLIALALVSLGLLLYYFGS